MGVSAAGYRPSVSIAEQDPRNSLGQTQVVSMSHNGRHGAWRSTPRGLPGKKRSVPLFHRFGRPCDWWTVPCAEDCRSADLE
eukprot:scaffold4621_cov128-Isochrysis_galbana.AAC.6